MTPASLLHPQLLDGRLLAAPIDYAGITARTVVQAGFDAAYTADAGVAVAGGFPNCRLATLTEMVEAAGVMTRSVTVPHRRGRHRIPQRTLRLAACPQLWSECSPQRFSERL